MKHHRIPCLVLLMGLALAVTGHAAHGQSAEKELDPATEAAYRELTAGIEPAALDRHIRALAAFGSRVPGYPGARRAAAYVEDQFRAAGLTEVAAEQFEVSVPVSDGLRIRDPIRLVGRLTQASPDALTRHVISQLPPDTRALLNACPDPLQEFLQADAAVKREEAAFEKLKKTQPALPGGLPISKPAALSQAEAAHQKADAALRAVLVQLEPYLIDALNWLCEGPSLYDPRRFAGVSLGSEARQLLAQQPQGRQLVALNRLLLADAYRDGLAVLGAWMVIDGVRYRLYPLWPNMVQTSKLPSPEKGGLQAPVIDVGPGKLAHFNGKTVDGSVVMVDFNSAQEWLNAPRLGAKAVLFVEPESTQRGEAEGKFISIPLAIPRFWISRSDADAIRARYQLASDGNQLVPKAQLFSEVFWQRRPARNIVGWVRGTDPKLQNQYIIVESYYDSMSVVPDLSPGAEAACGVATQIELARLYAKKRPKRSVLFLATGAHHLALKGIRAYMEDHFHEYGLPPAKVRFTNWLGNRSTNAGKGVVGVILLLCIISLLRPLGRFGIAGKVLRVVGAAALAGGLLFFVSLSPKAEEVKPRLYVFTALDLTSKTPRVGLFYKGMYYNFRQDIQRKFADFARVQRENADQIVKTTLGGTPSELFADGVNPISGKDWRNFIPGKIALDHEPVTMAGALGVGFVTTDDARPNVDTPFDTPEKVSIFNLSRQARLLAALYYDMLNDNNDPEAAEELTLPVTEPSTFSRMTLTGGFARLHGRVVEFDPRRSFIPDKEVPGGLAVVENANKTFMGVRGPMVEQVDDRGRFEFAGVAPLTAYGRNTPTFLAAYHINADTGAIDYAPDLGVTGAKDYPLQQSVTTGEKEATIVVFNCVSTSLYDLVDPQMLRALTGLSVLDGQSNAEPRMYGYAISKPELWISHVEDAAVIYSSPPHPEAGMEKATRIKVLMGAGPISTRFVLINSTKQNPEGEGYETKASGAIFNTAQKVAQDMWNMDEYRIQRLAKYRIINKGLNDLHALAKSELEKAQEALDAKDYERFDAHSRAAWGYESRAYPDVQRTAQDVVKGVLFYLWLLLPFSFFMERLLWGFSDLKRQLLAGLGVFVVIFVILLNVHPAFEITMNPLIVLLAFIMLALAVMIITLVVGKFEQQLKEYQKAVGGVHKADIGRAGVAIAAFGLGVSNMRKRKARTFFTCITLIILTFTVLSFTSVVTGMRFNKVPSPGTPGYQGLMLRDAMWTPLEESAYRIMHDEFGAKHAVAPRAWFFSSEYGEQSFVRITSNKNTAGYDAKAVVGLTDAEAAVTRPQKALACGRWLRPDERYVAILPEAVAESLGIDERNYQTATVRFSGTDFKVIGILNNNRFKGIKDLDREPLTPVDFIMMEKLRQQGKDMGESGFREYVHLEPDNIVIIPFQTILNLGGGLRSLGMDFVTKESVDKVLQALMPRLGMNLYAGMGDHIFRWSSIASTSITGVGDLFIPILIAALIVLNTMLGSVFERIRDIHIFSSIGLAPSHVGVLFMAEAFVYAVIGAITGYLLGQVTVKIIATYDLFPLLALNFSSVSAVFSTLLVIAVVLLSTLYPSRKASEVATPAIDRSWKVPDPKGDDWAIPLPFSVTGDQAIALNHFLHEWFSAYEEYSIGDFVTQNVQYGEGEVELGKTYSIELMAWLAPFDLGVSQHVELRTTPTDMEDVYDIMLYVHRESGDVSNWKRVNRRFLNTLRKQFLIWRTLGSDDRERYLGARQEGASAEESVVQPV
ncbi:MAG: M28 family peptidase [Armatimonadetes bacterium]|nr:M28 family peptidase [Armatimonadota bacterium]